MDWIRQNHIALKHILKIKKDCYISLMVNLSSECFYLIRTRTKNHRECYPEVVKGVYNWYTYEKIEDNSDLINRLSWGGCKYYPENETIYYKKHDCVYPLREFAQYCINVKLHNGKAWYLCLCDFPTDSSRLRGAGFTSKDWGIISHLIFESYIEAYELLTKHICEEQLAIQK